MAKRKTTPETETIALALRLLRAAFPDGTVDIEIHDAGPRDLAALAALGGRTISEGAKVRMVRAEVGGARVTAYDHSVRAEARA